jgi:hypothetical protein
MKILTIGATFIAVLGAQAMAATSINCEKATITKIYLPTSQYGAGTGAVMFSDGRMALLPGYAVGMDDPTDWKKLRAGDHVMTCANMKPYVETKKIIVVIDYDANLMFKSIWGAEGA